ncbi:hypothetical protein NKG94_27660 [Micromonospora sp. M12]
MHWDGSTGARIRVSLTWQRRRVGRLAALPTTVDVDIEVDVELLDRWTGRTPRPTGRRRPPGSPACTCPGCRPVSGCG